MAFSGATFSGLVNSWNDAVSGSVIDPLDWNELFADIETAFNKLSGGKTAEVVDVASALTCDIGAAASYRVRVTGTTTITSFGTMANCLRMVHFASGITVNHNASSLILPGGANITFTAGDAVIASSDGSGNWRVLFMQQGGLSVTLAGVQTLSNKTLDNSNAITVKDASFTIQDDSDTTKQAKFQLSGITTGTTRTFTVPDTSDTLVTLAATQTLTNKTLTSPTINTPTVSSPALTGTADVQQAIAATGDISPTQITSDQNDYAPTGFSTASVLRISTDASRNITGLAGGSDGRIIWIYNVGSFAAVLKDESASSTAANRFGFGADLTLGSKQGAQLIYDSTSSRWRQTGGPSSSGGGSGTVTSVTASTGLQGGTITSSGSMTLDAPYLNIFGGRLTLTSGDPLNTAEVTAGQNLYYAPWVGKSVPVLVSGSIVQKDIVSSSTDQVGLTLALAGSANWAADSLHDVFAIVDSGTLKLATRAWDSGMLPTETQITNVTTITTGTGANAWSNASAAFDGTTVQAIASCARIAVPSNSGLANYLGQDWGVGVTKTVSKVVITAASDNFLQGSGSTALQIVVQGSSDNSNWTSLGFFYLDASANGTTYTIPINISNQVPYRYHRVGFTGSASYSINVAEIQFYQRNAPASGRRLTRYQGLLVNDASMTARTGASTTVTTAQYEGTYLGTIHIDTATAGQITCHTTYGSSRTYGVWNAHNQRKITLRAGVLTYASSYNVTQQRWNVCQSGFQLQILRGLGHEAEVSFLRQGYMDCQTNRKAYEFGIGVDTTGSFSGMQGGFTVDTTGQAFSFSQVARLTVPTDYPLGFQTIYGIERVDSGSGTASLFVEQRSTVLEASWMG